MYLIIGASGYLGSYLIKNVLSKTNEEIIATYNTHKPQTQDKRVRWLKLDVSKLDSIKIFNECLLWEQSEFKVIYLAAYHHPDKVMENPKLAWHNNITSYANFLNALEPVKNFYYISTDMVYGEGSKDIHFKEDAPLNPINLYGRQKALAEQITLSYGYNVIRYPFIIGPSLIDDKPHFYDNIKTSLQKGEAVEMFKDSYRSALSFNDCAGYLIDLAEKYPQMFGEIINISGDEDLSKYEIGLRIAANLKADKRLIKSISIKEDSGIFKEKRPSTLLLDNQKIKKLLGLTTIKMEL